MATNLGPEKRLKRGLEDLSPLFRSSPGSLSIPTFSPAITGVGFDVQFVSVCVPDHEGDAFLANAYLASEVIRQTPLYASLVSIVPGMNVVSSKEAEPFPSLEFLDSRISRLSLSHQELWGLSRNGPVTKENGVTSTRDGAESSFLIFLEFEPTQFRSLARIALLLDRVVLFVQPQVESLREAYRLIKTFWGLNREIEYFILFRGKDSPQLRQGMLFERFSLIASRFLGISTDWLGNLSFPEKDRKANDLSEGAPTFNLELMLRTEGLSRPLTPEKSRFWQRLHKALAQRFERASLPSL